MTDAYTENLADFGIREIKLLNKILSAWIAHGLPDSFYDEGVKPAFNRNSGCVFLTNVDYQVAMMNGVELEVFYSLPYGGAEGFLSDLLAENNPDDLHPEDTAYMLEHIDTSDLDVPAAWANARVDYIIEDNG